MTGWLRGSLDDLERHIMRNEVLASEHLDTVLEARIIVRQWARSRCRTLADHDAQELAGRARNSQIRTG